MPNLMTNLMHNNGYILFNVVVAEVEQTVFIKELWNSI